MRRYEVILASGAVVNPTLISVDENTVLSLWFGDHHVDDASPVRRLRLPDVNLSPVAWQAWRSWDE